ncbi:MAG: hypothetical protein RIR96_133 [Bacteroidota bacterium]|jgi:hypothetical protein
MLRFSRKSEKMEKPEVQNRLKRLRNRYRLVVMNEDTYEEVVKFKLTRLSVYIALSSAFVFMVAITSALIIFTPLKYYLPGVGYGNAKQVREFRKLKIRTDSIERSLNQQQQYFEHLEKVLEGKVITKDTQNLKLPKLEDIDE